MLNNLDEQQLKPNWCPFCGQQTVEELQPSELLIDEDYWLVRHFECTSCSEVFDRIVLADPEDDIVEGQGEDIHEA